MTENKNNFSGGELQRIILARMFCNPRPVYCLDEVVSGLQYSLAKAIENTIIDHMDATVINVSHRTDAETLRKAQQHPENYHNLVVRIAGFSAYFVDMTREMQDDIIARAEHRV